MIKKLTGLTASLVALASTASATVKINDYIGIEGYVVGSGTILDPDTGSNTDTLFDSGANNLDSALFAFVGTYGDFSGKASLLYVPGEDSGDARVLDLYASYKAGALTLTGGNFLSYLGYEAFHAASMAQLTWGYASGIPAYHSGVKADFAVSETFSLGASVTDSLFAGKALGAGGDGDFDDGLGYEFVATYTGIEKLTVFLGLGVDDDDAATSDYSADIWASYALTDKLTIAGEVSYLDDVSTSYILFAQYFFTEKAYSVFRWSFANDDVTDDYATYATVSPGYVLTENFTIRGEVSYSDDSILGKTKGLFYGVQGVFKF